MRFWRIALAVTGILVVLYGAGGLVTSVPFGNLALLAVWMIGAVVIHDGILSPVVLSTGWLLHRLVPERGRRYLQAGFVAGGLITVVAIPMILQQGAEPSTKALLRQDFRFNLTVLLVVVAVVSLVLYAIRVARDRSAPTVRS